MLLYSNNVYDFEVVLYIERCWHQTAVLGAAALFGY
jgi:hypothetical protein